MAKISASPGSNIFLQVPGFPGEGVRHGFFGRAGGTSGGIYGGLNCGVGSSDNPADVKANREAVAALMGVEPGNVLSLYQVHGDVCLKVNAPHKERPQADAQVTDVPGLAISILTADCAPVLFYGRNDKGPVVGAAHAGWKGALGGVLDSTVYAMEEYGVKAKDIKAAIGPCISKPPINWDSPALPSTSKWQRKNLEQELSNPLGRVDKVQRKYLKSLLQTDGVVGPEGLEPPTKAL